MPHLLVKPGFGFQINQRTPMGGCCSLPIPRPGPRPVASHHDRHRHDAGAAGEAAPYTLESCVFCQIACGCREPQKVVFQVRGEGLVADGNAQEPRCDL